jgi:polysaccharide biosynthesis transport protein
MQCLGLVPAVPSERGAVSENDTGKFFSTVKRLLVPSRPALKARGGDLSRKVLDDPFSHFSEGLRSVKTTLDILALGHSMKCIGIISAIPGEGKSTISVNLANLFAGSGQPTLLIDADMRNPQLSRLMAAGAEHGMLELLGGSSSLSAVTRRVPQSKLQFVPTILQHRIANTGDLLASERMRSVLEQARREYQHVIVDLPPLGPVSDSRAVASLIDAFILVVNWGHTRFDVVNEALSNFDSASDKIVGVVLNKVDYQQLRNMEPYSYNYYYNKNYAKYGYTYSDH